MSKVRCDICNVDLNKSGFAHHKKTKKHLIEDAKKYGKYDFATSQIIQTGGVVENKLIDTKPIEAKPPEVKPKTTTPKPKKDVEPLEEITLSFLHEPVAPTKTNEIKFERLNPNLSRKEKNIKTLALLDDFMKDVTPKPYFIEQLRSHIKTFEKIV
jgi:hypothetical protein